MKFNESFRKKEVFSHLIYSKKKLKYNACFLVEIRTLFSVDKLRYVRVDDLTTALYFRA